jgi:hypothetical protein
MDSTQVGADSIWMQEQKSKIETWLSKTEYLVKFSHNC